VCGIVIEIKTTDVQEPVEHSGCHVGLKQ
jgi:hypothetical protein